MEISESVVIAIIGCLGAIIGSIATVSVSILSNCLQDRKEEKICRPRKDMLISMLNHPTYSWRNLKTLSHVVGLDETETKNLLVSIGARASEDGNETWALISRHPLPSNKK